MVLLLSLFLVLKAFDVIEWSDEVGKVVIKHVHITRATEGPSPTQRPQENICFYKINIVDMLMFLIKRSLQGSFSWF